MKNSKPKRIGIDARFYGPLGKGLGRYTKEVVDGVIKTDKENEYVIFLSKENFDDLHVDGTRVKKVLATPRWYTLAEQIVMPMLIWREKVDLMHFLHFNVPVYCPTKFVVTIHDLILTKHPTYRATTLSPWLYRLKNLAYRVVIKSAVRGARQIIAVSEFTKGDVVDQFGVDEKKIVVTYEGVAEKLLNATAGDETELKERYGIKQPYLLYVGNAYPHKNLDGLVEVFSKIKRAKPELNLVLVGKEDYFYKRLKDQVEARTDLEEGIVFPGYVPDEDLALIYREALVYVFPSLYEGFGLPPLEAMAQGCPVVSSNKTSMPELLQEAAEYFDPENPEEMRVKITRLIDDEAVRQQLKERGLAQVKKFSWSTLVKQTLNVYNNL